MRLSISGSPLTDSWIQGNSRLADHLRYGYTAWTICQLALLWFIYFQYKARQCQRAAGPNTPSLSVIDFTNLFYFGPVACFTALPSARSSRCATNRSPVKNLRADARLDCGTLTRKSSLKAQRTLRRYFGGVRPKMHCGRYENPTFWHVWVHNSKTIWFYASKFALNKLDMCEIWYLEPLEASCHRI